MRTVLQDLRYTFRQLLRIARVTTPQHEFAIRAPRCRSRPMTAIRCEWHLV